MLKDNFNVIVGLHRIRNKNCHPCSVLPQKGRILITSADMLEENIFSRILSTLPEPGRLLLNGKRSVSHSCFIEEFDGKTIILIDLNTDQQQRLFYSVLQDLNSEEAISLSGLWMGVSTLTVEEEIADRWRALNKSKIELKQHISNAH